MKLTRASVEFGSAYRPRQPGLLLPVVLLLAACSPSQSDLVEQQSKTAASSTETALMALDAWRSQAVPSHYAEGTLKAMREKLAQAADEVQGTESLTSEQRAEMMQPMSQAAEALERAQAAIAAADHGAVERSREDARAAASSLSGSASRNVLPKQ